MWCLILNVQLLLRRNLYSLSNMVFPFESDLTFCNTLIPGICVLSSLDFMDVDFPSDKAILEAMIMDIRPPTELENLQVGY
jgi:hypothetical protein